MSKLPQDWISANFLDIFDIQGGTQPPKSTFKYKFYPGYIQLLQIRDFGEHPVSTYIEDTDSLKKCTEEDILIARYGASLGRILTGFSGAYNVAMAKVIIPSGMNRRFVYHLLTTELFQAPLRLISRSAQSGFNKQDIAEITFPIPPLNEQERIADKLDTLLLQVDACRNRLDRIPLILKRFRQSVLLLAMSGELTADWRNVFHKSVEWRNVLLSEICISIVDGTHQAPPQTKSGIPFITISAINDGRLRIEKATRFVSSLYFEQLQPSRKPVIGDVLFSVTGSIAIPALVDVNEPFIFQRHIAILKPDSSRIISKFLFYVLNSENIKRQSQDVATGTAQKTISISRLRAFEIDLPCIDEQIEVVQRIESLFAYADSLEDSYRKAYLQIEQLTPTLLNMAFCGELVPQDPADEPASVLLERIRIEKAAQPIKPRVSTSRRSTMTKLSQESVKEVIHQLPNDKFSFDELRGKIPGDYDLLKDILFTLLDETEPILQHVFDREAESMYFVRGSK